MKKVYLLLTDIGLIAPLVLVALFLREYGWNPALFWQQLWASHGSTLAMTDLVLSSVVFWIWMVREARRHKIGHLWLYVLLNLGVGLCLALPLFLFVRERKIEATGNSGTTTARPRVALEGTA